MHIMYSVNNHNRTRVGTTVVPTHSRPCFRRGKLVPAEAGSGNPGVVPAKAGNQGLAYWIPPYQVRGRLSQARNDKPVNICFVMYKSNSILKNQSGAALVIALVMMIVLTLIGLASIFTSTFEMKISGNKKGSTDAFYRGEGGIQVVTARVENFSTSTHAYPYNPFDGTDPNNIPALAVANITYNSSMLGAPRGVGVSATNFEFQHFLITSTGTDPTVSLNPSKSTVQEKVVRLVPTQQGGY